MQTRARARAVARTQEEVGIEWIESSSDRFFKAIGCSNSVFDSDMVFIESDWSSILYICCLGVTDF